MNLSFLDLFFLAVVLLFAIIALIRGVWNELLDKAAIFLGVWFAILFYARLALLFNAKIKSNLLCCIIAFLSIFVVVFLLVKIIQHIVSPFLQNDLLGPLNHTLGFAFGVLEGLAVVVLLVMLLNALPWKEIRELLDGSVVYRFIKYIDEKTFHALQGIESFGVVEVDVSGEGL